MGSNRRRGARWLGFLSFQFDWRQGELRYKSFFLNFAVLRVTDEKTVD